MIFRRSWFWLTEVIVAIAVFWVLMFGVAQSFRSGMSNYQEWVASNMNKSLVSDIYAYLYAYKRSYGTIDFTSMISNGYTDTNCNGNYASNASLKGYCLVYPYWDSWVVKFYKGNINNSSATITGVYLTDNNNTGRDGNGYLINFGLRDISNTVIVALKQDFADYDLYTGFIGIYDKINNVYIVKKNITLK